MQDIIVFCGLIFLLLIFPLQDIRDTAIASKLEAFDAAVHTSVNIARLDGYFTGDNKSDLRDAIEAAFPEVDASSIVINVTDDRPRYRTNVYETRELIYYEISVPVEDVIFMGRFLGIPDNLNSFTYEKKSFVTSERLP